MPLGDDVDLRIFAGDMTDNWTGADLEAWSKEAAISALREDLSQEKVSCCMQLKTLRGKLCQVRE